MFSIRNKKRAIVLHFSKADNPITFALVPTLGEMFIAFQSPGFIHIDKQLMKGGQDHFHVIESGLSQYGQINIVVDEAHRMIYWSDSEKFKIEFSNFEGTNIKNFVRSDRKPGVMALIDEHLYWTSLGSKTLQWRNMTGSGGVKMVNLEKPPGMRKLPNVISIAAGVPLKVSNHPCTINNGGCSDVCVSSGLQVNFSCSSGFIFIFVKFRSRNLIVFAKQVTTSKIIAPEFASNKTTVASYVQNRLNVLNRHTHATEKLIVLMVQTREIAP